MKIGKILLGITFSSMALGNQAQAWQKEVQLEGKKLWTTQVQEIEGYQYVQQEKSVIQENNEALAEIHRVLNHLAESKLGEDYLVVDW